MRTSSACPPVWHRLAWLAVFAIAMGLLEAVCVIYLRRLLPVEDGQFLLPRAHRNVEIVREACTLVMLASVAWLAGIHARSRVACFFFAFGIWDILYYVGLRWLAGWPESLLTWDCLFLIPEPWYGPVLAPVLISLWFVAACCVLHAREQQGRPLRIGAGFIALELLACAIWYASFVVNNHGARAAAAAHAPYPWGLFAAGLLAAAAGLWLSARGPQEAGSPGPAARPAGSWG